MNPRDREEPQAPGCFGMGACFDPTTETCASCDYAARCQPIAYRSLKVIHKEVPVPELIRLHNPFLPPEERIVKSFAGSGSKRSKFSLSPEQQRMLEAMPSKPRKITKRLFEDGVDVASDLARGINPFESEPPKLLRAPVRLLLQGGFSKRELKEEYLRESPGMSDGTAKSNVSIAVNILSAIGAMKMLNGKFRRVV